MMKGHVDGGANSAPVTLIVSNLPPSFIGAGYNVYVYFDANYESFFDTVARYEVRSGSRSQVFFGRNSYEDFGDTGTYVLSTAIAEKDAAAPGNYFLFAGWTNTSFTLTAYGASGSPLRAPVNGIQLVVPAQQTANQLPVAGANSFTTGTNTELVISLGDLLSNDTDSDGDQLFVVAADAVSSKGGTVTFGTNAITYMPPTNYSGPDTFTYTVDDGRGGTAKGTVSVTVATGEYIPPVGENAVISFDLGAGSMSGALASQMDPGEVAGVVPVANWNSYQEIGAPLTTYKGQFPAYTVVDSRGVVVGATSMSFTGPNNYQLSDIPDDPGNNRMMRGYLDGYGSSTPSLVVVSNLPSAFTDKGYDVYVYFQGFTADPPRISRYELKGGSAYQVKYGRQASVPGAEPFVEATGTADAGADTPEGNYVLFTGIRTGTFTLTSYGTSGDMPRASVQGIQIVARGTMAPNRAPAANDDTLPPVNINTSATYNATDLLANDTDPDGDTLVVTAAGPASANGGTVVLSGSNITYTPATNFSGPDSFTYTVSDGRGGSATGTASMNVVLVYVPATPNPVISIDFGAGTQYAAPFTNPMETNEVAGVIPVANWNSFAPITNDPPASGSLAELIDDSGLLVYGASVAFDGPDVYSVDTTPDTPGDNRMMKGYLDGWGIDAASHVTLTGIPAAFTDKGYSVYVYYDEPSGGRVARYEITSGSVTQVAFGIRPASGFTGEYIQADGASDEGTNTPAGNYVKFSGLTGSSFTLLSYGTSGDLNRASVQGLQIAAGQSIQPGPVEIQLHGAEVILSWPGNGLLQSAPTVTGPWTDVTGATSPLTVTPVENQRFYRVRSQ
ncbi:MAG: cadherin-like domain-containing protein [Candidatus Omnitrophica bacterium]|nr:cadherin-like domain-containing protein [Candidatus Omnitrophota bacterium]